MKIEKSTTTYPLSAFSIEKVSENTGIFFGADRHGAQKYPAYEADFGKCPAELT